MSETEEFMEKLVVDATPKDAKVVRVLDLDGLIDDIKHTARNQKNKYESPMSFVAALCIGLAGIAAAATDSKAWRFLAIGALAIAIVGVLILCRFWWMERGATNTDRDWLIDKVKRIRDDSKTAVDS